MLVCAQNQTHCLQNRYPDDLLVPANVPEFESYSDMVDTYQLYMCSEVRLCTKNLQINYINYDPSRQCCDTCSCHSSCGTMQNCCPDVTESPIQKYSNHPECIRMKYYNKTAEPTAVGEDYKVFTTCSNKSQLDWVDKCQHLDMLGAVPVSLTNSHIAFKNTYCAWCNNEFDVVEWKVKVVCDKGDTMYASTLEDLRIKINLRADECNVVFMPPYRYTVTCYDAYSRYIDSCNVTGKWKIYHPWIEQACHSYTSVYYFGSDFSRDKYKNVFCFFCNMDSNYMKTFHPNSIPHNYCSPKSASVGVKKHAFSAILNLQTKLPTPTTAIRRKCEDGFVLDNVKVHLQFFKLLFYTFK